MAFISKMENNSGLFRKFNIYKYKEIIFAYTIYLKRKMDKLEEVKNFCKEQVLKIDKLECHSSYFEAKSKAYGEIIDFIDTLKLKNKKDVGEEGQFE